MCKVNDEQEVNYDRILRCTFMYKQLMFKNKSFPFLLPAVKCIISIKSERCSAQLLNDVTITREKNKMQSKMENTVLHNARKMQDQK